MFDTRKMKKTTVCATCLRSLLVCSSGRMSSIEAPVVPTSDASSAPSAEERRVRRRRGLEVAVHEHAARDHEQAAEQHHERDVVGAVCARAAGSCSRRGRAPARRARRQTPSLRRFDSQKCGAARGTTRSREQPSERAAPTRRRGDEGVRLHGRHSTASARGRHAGCPGAAETSGAQAAPRRPPARWVARRAPACSLPLEWPLQAGADGPLDVVVLGAARAGAGGHPGRPRREACRRRRARARRRRRSRQLGHDPVEDAARERHLLLPAPANNASTRITLEVGDEHDGRRASCTASSAVVQRELELINESLGRYAVEVVQGQGASPGPHADRCHGIRRPGPTALFADFFVIATGSAPNRPADVQFDGETVFDSTTVPRSRACRVR